MEIICFRPAQSFGDKEDITQGHTDFNLTDEGINQAKKLNLLKDKISNEITNIYSSDLIRAYRTSKLAFQDYDIKKDKNFRAQDFGSVAGSLDSYIESNPEYLLNEPDSFKIPFPDGESIMDVKKRVKESFFNIIDNHEEDETIIISCHFTPLICILSIINEEPLSDVWPKEYFEDCESIHIDYDIELDEFEIIDRYLIEDL